MRGRTTTGGSPRRRSSRCCGARTSTSFGRRRRALCFPFLLLAVCLWVWVKVKPGFSPCFLSTYEAVGKAVVVGVYWRFLSRMGPKKLSFAESLHFFCGHTCRSAFWCMFRTPGTPFFKRNMSKACLGVLKRSFSHQGDHARIFVAPTFHVLAPGGLGDI